jgi:hypothetical protein
VRILFTLGPNYAYFLGMNAKSTTAVPPAEQQTELADPTRSILKCVELRKRKAAETQLIIVRLRAQVGSTTHR